MSQTVKFYAPANLDLTLFISNDAGTEYVASGTPSGFNGVYTCAISSLQAGPYNYHVVYAGSVIEASPIFIGDSGVFEYGILNAELSGRFKRTIGAVVSGKTNNSSTTVISVNTISPSISVADQLRGRIVIFDKDTLTAELRGTATPIVSNTLTDLTVYSLPVAPSSGDTFTVT